MDNQFECACEHGLDCTRTTMCRLQSVSDELELKLEAAEQQNQKFMESITGLNKDIRKAEQQLREIGELPRYSMVKSAYFDEADIKAILNRSDDDG